MLEGGRPRPPCRMPCADRFAVLPKRLTRGFWTPVRSGGIKLRSSIVPQKHHLTLNVSPTGLPPAGLSLTRPQQLARGEPQVVERREERGYPPTCSPARQARGGLVSCTNISGTPHSPPRQVRGDPVPCTRTSGTPHWRHAWDPHGNGRPSSLPALDGRDDRVTFPCLAPVPSPGRNGFPRGLLRRDQIAHRTPPRGYGLRADIRAATRRRSRVRNRIDA